jgi:hypothetical protein
MNFHYAEGAIPFLPCTGELLCEWWTAGESTVKGESVAELCSGTPPVWVHDIKAWEHDEGLVFLVAIDTVGFDTGLIRDRIRTAISVLHSVWGIERFVLNMSFAIIPCDPDISDDEYLERIGENPEYLALQDYLDSLNMDEGSVFGYLSGQINLRQAYGQPGSSTIAEFGSDIQAEDSDPLSKWLMKLREASKEEFPEIKDLRVISVAASGNHGNAFPFAPAIWETVISVSATTEPIEIQTEQGGALLYAPNAGEVAMGDKAPDGGVGTSYAAPALSHVAALYLLGGGGVSCVGPGPDDNTSITTTPPLAYAYHSVPEKWLNLDLDTAAAQYCPGFSTSP